MKGDRGFDPRETKRKCKGMLPSTSKVGDTPVPSTSYANVTINKS